MGATSVRAITHELNRQCVGAPPRRFVAFDCRGASSECSGCLNGSPDRARIQRLWENTCRRRRWCGLSREAGGALSRSHGSHRVPEPLPGSFFRAQPRLADVGQGEGDQVHFGLDCDRCMTQRGPLVRFPGTTLADAANCKNAQRTPETILMRVGAVNTKTARSVKWR
jgi:hypothetical protein